MTERQLILMRHAKSDWDSSAASDYDRPLARRGLKDAPRMGRWLKKQKLLPDRIISSPALRAKQTTEQVCQELSFATASVNYDERIYAAESAELLSVIHDIPDNVKCVILVGHNPGMDTLLQYLAGYVAPNHSGKLMTTAAVAVLQLKDSWSALTAGSAKLVGLKRPKELRDN